MIIDISKNKSLNEGFGRRLEHIETRQERELHNDNKNSQSSSLRDALQKRLDDLCKEQEYKDEDYDKSLAKIVKEESISEGSQSIKTVDLTFNGKHFSPSIYVRKGSEYLLNKVDSAIKALNNPALFDYLYSYHKDLFDEINDDNYFDGKKITSGNDIKKAISSIDTIALGFKNIYISGECWFDDEHGFSICFPDGKFVKSKYDKYNYKRDEGENVNYCPKCTLLGEHSSSKI